MRVTEAYPSTYLKAVDLQDKTIKVTIDHYQIEDVGDGSKPVLYFVGKEKGLVLNRTNADELSISFGDEMDNWSGKIIELFTMRVSYQGRMVPGLRVRAAQQQIRPAPAPVPRPQQTASSPAINGRAEDERYNEANPPPIADEEIPF